MNVLVSLLEDIQEDDNAFRSIDALVIQDIVEQHVEEC